MMTEKQLARVVTPGHYRADHGLYLRVEESGAGYWIQRIVIQGKRTNIGIGNRQLITPMEAKEIALANRRSVMEGRNPLAAKRMEKAPLFRDAMERVASANSGAWKESTAYRWRRILEVNVIPAIGDIRVDLIDRTDVLKILTPIWNTKPQAARAARQHMKQVFEWSQAHGFIENNPAGEMINGALPKQAAVENQRALPFEDIPEAIQLIRKCDANLPSKLCVEFVALTAVRGAEARGAKWDEIDMDARTWTIPKERMKKGKEHIVPLSDAAMDILIQAADWAAGSELVFPSPRGRKVMTDSNLLNVLKFAGLKEKMTIHGLRSSFKTWASHKREDRELVEMCMAHTIGNAVENAYKRTTLTEQRRGVMTRWAEFVSGKEKRASLALVAG